MITIVKSVQQDGTWNSNRDNTLFYRHEYEFEDGIVLQASHKTVTPFKPGDEVEYEITKDNEYGKQGKVKKVSNYNGGKFDQKGIKIGHAINNATLIAIHLNKADKETIKHYAKQIYKLSEELNNEL